MTQPPASDSDTSSATVQGCLDACVRCRSLVDSIVQAGPPAAERAYASIGPHLRHCLDHFNCLLRGLDSGVVDYDARDRDPVLERDPGRFREVLASVLQGLESLASADGTRSLRVRQAAAAQSEPVFVESNLERELVFLSGHTIHHLAAMKLLAEAEGIAVASGLDLAFSTAAYLDRVKQPD